MRQYPIPKYRRHSSGQAAVRLGGKDHYLGLYGTEESRKKYDRLIKKWLTEKGVPAPPSLSDEGTPLEFVLASYWVHASGYYRKLGKPTHQLHRIKAAFAVVRQQFPDRPAAAFGPRELKAAREEMVRRGWSRHYINACVGCIKRAWRWAGEESIIPAHLWHALAVVRNLQRGRSAAREAAAVGPVPDAVVAATLPHLPPDVADMVRLQRRTGMRPLEVCRMRAEDVDRSGTLPDGQKLKGVWTYHVKEEGNKLAHRGVQRVVLIGPQAQAVLLPHLLRRGPAGYVFSPKDVAERWLRERGFSTRRGKNRTPGEFYPTTSYTRAVAKAAARAKVPHWHPSQLRHACATEIRALQDLHAAGAVLGHASLETTTTYACEDMGRAADVMRRIG